VGIWALGFVLTLLGFVAGSLRPSLWMLAFTASGVLCVANAVRARRFHCMFTGPVFLLGAVAVGMRWIGLLLGDWNWIGAGVLSLVGGALVIEILVKRNGDACC
jgi:hypothetical protein